MNHTLLLSRRTFIFGLFAGIATSGLVGQASQVVDYSAFDAAGKAFYDRAVPDQFCFQMQAKALGVSVDDMFTSDYHKWQKEAVDLIFTEARKIGLTDEGIKARLKDIEKKCEEEHERQLQLIVSAGENRYAA